MFHVKRKKRNKFYNEKLDLLADTKLLEDRAKDVLDVYPAQQPAKHKGCSTQLFGGQLLALFYKLQTQTQVI